MEEAIREALSANSLTVEDVDVFVPHQANIRILKAVAQRLGLPLSKTVVNLDRYGNTSAASIPLALDEAIKAGRIQRGHIVCIRRLWSGTHVGIGGYAVVKGYRSVSFQFSNIVVGHSFSRVDGQFRACCLLI